MKTPIRSLLAGAWLALSVASTANAGSLDVFAGSLIYSDPGTVDNRVRVTSSGGWYHLTDPADLNVVITQRVIDAGCFVGVQSIACPATSVTKVTIDAGNGNDTIDVSGLPIQATLDGGAGFDRVTGGDESDQMLWHTGDGGGDEFDGGPGNDAIVAYGSPANETFLIAPDGPGFRLTRDFVTVWIKGTNVEQLFVDAGAGDDSVYPTLLPSTVQVLHGGYAGHDVVGVNGEGACPWFEREEFTLPGRAGAQIRDFESFDNYNYVCGAIMQLLGGQLDYEANNYANDLHVTRSGSTYTFHDELEPAITPSPDLRAAGCTTPEPNTVVCPTAPITSFRVYMGGGDDTADFAGALVPVNFRGDAGNDTYVGGQSDDTIAWMANGGGSDTIDGGPGYDTLDFLGSQHNETYVISKDGLGFRMQRNIENTTTLAQGIERLELDVEYGLDTITTVSMRNTEQRFAGGGYGSPVRLHVDADYRCLVREGNTLASAGRPPIVFDGVENLDVLDVFNNSCLQDACAFESTSGCKVNGVANQPCEGTSGNDSIVGTAGPDVIHAGSGRDRVSGGNGDDIICGDAGDDSLAGGSGDDTIVGGAGVDKISGAAGADTLLGGDDPDTLSGGSDADTLDGGKGDDRLKGGGDHDYLDGGEGFDILDGGGTLLDTCNDADQLGPFVRCEVSVQ